jgi:hypothetical protein
MTVSASERQRRSDLAKRMHREGKFGSKAVQRRATKKAAELRTQRAAERASQMAQRFFERHYDEWEKAMLNGLRNGSPATRVRAAETIAKLALRGESLAVTEQRNEFEHLDREQALALLEEKLTTGPVEAILRARMAEQNGQIIEGTASEVVELRRT